MPCCCTDGACLTEMKREREMMMKRDEERRERGGERREKKREEEREKRERRKSEKRTKEKERDTQTKLKKRQRKRGRANMNTPAGIKKTSPLDKRTVECRTPATSQVFWTSSSVVRATVKITLSFVDKL